MGVKKRHCAQPAIKIQVNNFDISIDTATESTVTKLSTH